MYRDYSYRKKMIVICHQGLGMIIHGDGRIKLKLMTIARFLARRVIEYRVIETIERFIVFNCY